MPEPEEDRRRADRGRLFFALVAAVALAAPACRGGAASAPHAPDGRGTTVYVGTYTDAGSRGIYRFELDAATGATTAPVLAAVSENPSFLALHSNGKVLYAVNEVSRFGGERVGAVSAFAIDPATGNLAPLDQRHSGGADPCYLVVDRAGRTVLVANYTGGSVAALPLDPEGRFAATAEVRSHAGHGPNPARQEGPHAHQILLDPAERYAMAVDLGIDRIVIYRYDSASGRLAPDEPVAVAMPPGSGPRHLTWHPSGRFLYAISELASTVTVFNYEAVAGALGITQTTSTLPRGFTGINTAAEIVVSRDGRFLYASNRGDDSLMVFAIDGASGTLTALGRVPAGGRTPRQFAIDPTGDWLLVANQDSDEIALFRVDRATGALRPTGEEVRLSKPVCVLFTPPRTGPPP